MKQETKEFLEIVGVGIGLGGLLLGIMFSELPEALKYFIIIGLFLLLTWFYIRIVIENRMNDLEDKFKKLEEKR